MSFLVLVVDDEPDVEMLFRQQFRRDLHDNRFRMDFAQSAASALQRIGDAAGESLILILSDRSSTIAASKNATIVSRSAATSSDDFAERRIASGCTNRS